jgi:hypothetical protein
MQGLSVRIVLTSSPFCRSRFPPALAAIFTRGRCRDYAVPFPRLDNQKGDTKQSPPPTSTGGQKGNGARGPREKNHAGARGISILLDS